MKKPSQHLIAEVPRKQAKVEITIGIDLGDVWSHYCTLNQDGEVVDRGRFRTTPKAIEKWFTDVPPARVAMEAGTHSIWISEQLQELGHEVIVANVRELRAISHSDRKSDQVDAEKLARYARLDPNILRPIAHRTVAAARGSHSDSCAGPAGATAHCCGERRSRADEVLRLSYARLRHNVLRSAQPRRYAAWTGTGARSGAPADRGHDAEDQAVRSADPATRPDRVSGDAGAAEGSWRRPPHGLDLRADAGQQGAVRAKSRCWLLSWPATSSKSVRRSRSSARHHPRRQRVPSKSPDRVFEPYPPTTRKRLGTSTVGSALGRKRRQAGQEQGRRCSSPQAGRAASSPLEHPGTVHAVL